MSELVEVVPCERSLPIEAALAVCSKRAVGRFEPFAPPVVEFCSALATAISRDSEARRYPELQTLAFCMRRSALHQLRAEYEKLATRDTLLTPRGVVFHLPPSNVDTIFLYSWLNSVLVGNRNIVRLSQHESPQVALLCRLYRAVLAGHPELATNTVMYRYGHDAAITQAFSDICDLRVIWGGDATVNTIRAITLPPHAREIAFPNRYSMSVFRAAAVVNLSGPELETLAERFYNDVYWFDQMACSSPQLLVWIGSEEETCDASLRLSDAVSDELRRRQFQPHAGIGIEKLTFLSRAAIDRDVLSADRRGSAWISARLGTLVGFDREHCGGGFLFEARLDALDRLAPHLRRRDQTLTYFGFHSDDLRNLARLTEGEGVDRMVPVGQALNFNRYWDGMDLLAEFSRRIHIV